MRRIPVLLLILAAAQGRPAWHPTVDSYSRLKELFANPPMEYSTSPFLVWNGEVMESEIDQHLTAFRDQGVRSVFIHPRPGMITSYLSDRWFQLVRHTVDKGKSLGMEVWLYDENSYPSGFAGGHVPAEMPESWNEGQGLSLRRGRNLQPDPAKKYPVILRPNGEAGDTYLFELAFYDKRAWHGGFSYVDLIRPGVTEKFIELTMRGYEKTLAGDLGKRVPGIFTDEPNIIPPPGKLTMRWTPDLFAQFQKRWGYDLKPQLPALFEETGDWRKVRHNYYSTLLDLFIERWSKPWFDYTEKRGIQWTGHYWEHGWPNPQHGPDNMAMYAWHHVPGIDMLFNQFDEGVNAQFGNVRSVKELASVASQMGRRRTISETYGGAGWELRFEDMKRLGDWEYVLGVNFMNQHLAFGTLAGARKHDYPQSFTYHTPWWNDYHALAGYFARLSLALSSGEQVNGILVLEPTTTGWLYSSPAGAHPRLMENGRAFQAFLNRLEAAQVEYDLGCENILRDRAKVAGAALTVGQRSYGVIVLPPGTENLDSPTVKLLTDFQRGGGKVLSFVDPPRYVDGAESGEVAKWEKVSDLKLLASPDFEIVRTAPQGKLFHQRRRIDGGQIVFLVNSSLEENAAGSLKLGGRSATRLDPLTGSLAPYPARLDGARLALDFDLPPAGSLLLYVARTGQPAAAPVAPAAEKPVAASGPLSVRRLAPNTLTLDYCDLKLGAEVERGLYYYVAQEKIFRHHGLGTNPWNTAVQYKTSILDRNKFAPDSGFEAAFSFEVAGLADKSSLRAVVERPELWTVAINGHAVAPRKGEWWLDRAFGVFDISAHVLEGRNTLAVTARPMSIHAELEPVYILGDFGLAAQPAGWRITPPAALAAGAWKEQGLPLYSQAVSLPVFLHPAPRRGAREGAPGRLARHGGRSARQRQAGRHHRLAALRTGHHPPGRRRVQHDQSDRGRVAQEPARTAPRQNQQGPGVARQFPARSRPAPAGRGLRPGSVRPDGRVPSG
ncbi:MAG: hypothetical protein HY822_17765 [Acidobacteria bacterium]|nr:hypothetical protein [Acidobacteriota bacterium]